MVARVLRFRLPGREQVLGTWFAELFPELDRNARRRLLAEAAVRVDGREVDRAGMLCPAGARVEVDDLPEDLARTLRALLESRRAAIIQAGFAQDAADGSVSCRVWTDAPPWFRGSLDLGEVAGERDRAERRIDSKSDTSEESAKVADFVEPDLAFEISVEVETHRDGLAALRLRADRAFSVPLVCRALARSRAPLVGDLLEGGLATAALTAKATTTTATTTNATAATTATMMASGVPEGAAWPRPGKEERDEVAAPGFLLEVSDEAARAIGKGHVWLLPDAASDRADRFRPGSLLRVMDRAGRGLAWAHAEGDARLSARVWTLGKGSFKQADSVEARVARALARRRSLWAEGGAAEEGGTRADSTGATEAFRLIHGEGDDLPGLFVDRIGPLLRVLVSGRACEGFKDRVLGALQAQLPLTPEGEMWSILEVVHLRDPSDRAGGGRLERVRWIAGGPEAIAAAGYPVEDCGFRVRERGLALRVVPGWDDLCRTRPGYGLFVDQRENRARLEAHARRGGRWLNLFAHTGAFSASLLASGADEVISVDLSAAYLEDLEANLTANASQFKPGFVHESVRGDGRRYLETRAPGERFDGIVLDPPTAAAAGRRFWSVRRDLEPMLKACVELLAPGGVLLVTQNQAGPPLGLERILESIATRAHRTQVRLEPAPAGLDHPSRDGFPEGDPFEGALIQVK